MRAITAVLAVAAMGIAGFLSGCATPDHNNPLPATAIAPQSTSTQAATAPLPAAQALTDVMYRLADPAVPGTDKLALVANTSAADAVALDRFAGAMRDGGFTPVTFTATDIRWADGRPRDVIASVSVTTTNPANPGQFSLPMEFAPAAGGWQLTRDTAEMLFAFGNSR